MGAGGCQLPFVSGRLDLNQRLQVPQTCTLNPCATARCSNKIAQGAFYVKSIAKWQVFWTTIASFRVKPNFYLGFNVFMLSVAYVNCFNIFELSKPPHICYYYI